MSCAQFTLIFYLFEYIYIFCRVGGWTEKDCMCTRERQIDRKKKLRPRQREEGDVVRRRLYIIIHTVEVLVDDGRRRRGDGGGRASCVHVIRSWPTQPYNISYGANRRPIVCLNRFSSLLLLPIGFFFFLCRLLSSFLFHFTRVCLHFALLVHIELQNP